MKKKKRPIYALLLLTLPTLVVVVVVLFLMNWHVSTQIRVDLIVNRAVFAVGGVDSAQIVNSVGFQFITLEKFAKIEFSPESLEVADPAQYKFKEDEYPESAWKSLTVTPPVVITAGDETLQPTATLERATQGLNSLGVLDRVSAAPGSEVTLEVKGAKNAHLTIKVAHQKASTYLSIRKRFQLITDYCLFSGITGQPYSADALTYRAQLPNHDRFVKVTGQANSLVLILTISAEEATNLFYRGSIPITALDFTHLDMTGNRASTLVKDGKLTYPDYPKIQAVSFKAPDFIGLDRLEKFRIAEISLRPKDKGIQFQLEGIAGHAKTGSPEFPRDHRLTLFDKLWQNRQLTILFAIIVWVFPTTVGAYRLYKELKGR